MAEEKELSSKALKLLGASPQTVRKAFIIDPLGPSLEPTDVPIFVRADLSDLHDLSSSLPASKAGRILGVDDTATAEQQLAWLQKRSNINQQADRTVRVLQSIWMSTGNW